MLRYCLAVMVALLTLQGEAEAGGNQRHNILCFTQSGLEQVLNRIVNQQQFLRNSPWHDITKGEFNRAGCVIGSIPSGSTAALVDLHETGHGFIFSIMELRYDSTTGQIMYAADGIFETKDWLVGRGHRHGSDHVVPRSCGAVAGLMSLSPHELPDYIHIPESCLTGRYTVM